MATCEISLTVSGSKLAQGQLRELDARCRLVGAVEEVERRIGRPVDDKLCRELFTIDQRGTELWIKATPEFHRVMAALDG